MKEMIIAQRYARALFLLALEEGKGREQLRELELVTEVHAEVPFFLKGLTDLSVDLTKKMGALEEIAKLLMLSSTTTRFFKLLLEKGRMELLVNIVEAYRAMQEKAEGIAATHITVADAHLAESVVEGVGRMMQDLLGKKVRAEMAIDRSILGGCIVRVGDIVYDGSLKGRFEQMKQELVLKG